jgi:hypothetical protein
MNEPMNEPMNESIVYFEVINILIKIYNKNLFITILKESTSAFNISTKVLKFVYLFKN